MEPYRTPTPSWYLPSGGTWYWETTSPCDSRCLQRHWSRSGSHYRSRRRTILGLEDRTGPKTGVHDVQAPDPPREVRRLSTGEEGRGWVGGLFGPSGTNLRPGSTYGRGESAPLPDYTCLKSRSSLCLGRRRIGPVQLVLDVFSVSPRRRTSDGSPRRPAGDYQYLVGVAGSNAGRSRVGDGPPGRSVQGWCRTGWSRVPAPPPTDPVSVLLATDLHFGPPRPCRDTGDRHGRSGV